PPGGARLCAAAASHPRGARAPGVDPAAPRDLLAPMRTVHVIGAGLAGLAAALRLSATGEKVVVHEATAQAGGRCRSCYHPAVGMVIDNGNHLLLSGNHAALAFAREIGGEQGLRGPEETEFPFVDLASGLRWRLRPNAGRLGWWVLCRGRRAPGTSVLDHLAI